jgi:hypothetical protein
MKFYVYTQDKYSFRGNITSSEVKVISDADIISLYYEDWKTAKLAFEEDTDEHSLQFSEEVFLNEWINAKLAIELAEDYDSWIYTEVDENTTRSSAIRNLVEDAEPDMLWHEVVSVYLEQSYRAGEENILKAIRTAFETGEIDILKELLNEK